jgi:hypothetical protein
LHDETTPNSGYDRTISITATLSARSVTLGGASCDRRQNVEIGPTEAALSVEPIRKILRGSTELGATPQVRGRMA